MIVSRVKATRISRKKFVAVEAWYNLENKKSGHRLVDDTNKILSKHKSFLEAYRELERILPIEGEVG